MEREPLSASGLVDILPAKPTVSADWNTFSLLVADTPLHATASFAETALGLYVSGISNAAGSRAQLKFFPTHKAWCPARLPRILAVPAVL